MQHKENHCATVENSLQYIRELKLALKGENMKLDSVLVGVLAIVAGVLVLWMPSILSWVVGIFLIVYGIVALTGKR